jgi:thiol-disulfide isomerase/thioredoxin
MKIAAALGLIALTSAIAAPAPSAPPPKLHVRTIDALAPLPLPYNEKADATAAVAAAKARAKAAHKLLLIDFGGNWCLDCRVLAGVMEQPEMRPFIQRHFVTVAVDSGRFDRNMGIPGHYGFKKVEGVPAVFIVDPKTDRLVNPKSVVALADARSMTPQGIADWLAQWVK